MAGPERILAIETATEACSVALFEGGELLVRDHRVLGRGHAERLVPMISELPGKGRADRILTSLGPGSFTGVRIGIATARALGFAWGAQVTGYPTLALIAAMAHAKHPGMGLTVCMNGGHGEWFVQEFGDDGLPIDQVQSLPPQSASDAFSNPVAAGNRAAELTRGSPHKATAIDLLPDAACALMLPDACLTQDLTPIYGRGPDAKPQSAKLPA